MDIKSVEWFQEKISNYPSSKKHNPDLVEFLTELKKLNRDARKSLVTQLRFEPMFDLVIKWNNPIYAEPFYELLVLIFEVMNAADIITVLEPYLYKLIGHVEGSFRDLVFNVLTRMVLDGDLEIFERHNKLVLESAKVLTDHKLENAAPCLNFLTKLALVVPQGTKIVFSGKMGEILREYCSCDKTLRYRIYELVTSVARVSPEAFEVICNCHLLNDLQDTLVGPTAHVDQLGYVNSVEVYKGLSQIPHCYDYLVKSGVIGKLEERVVEYGPGTMEDKVMPTIYQFFGDLFATTPGVVIRDAPNVVPRVMQLAIVLLDQTHVNRAAMVMLGQVATLPEGKRYLHKHQNQLDPVLEQASEFLRSGTEDNKISALDFTEALIFTKSADQSADILELTKAWFLKCMKSVKFLWEYAREPYPAIARASIQLMAVLSTLPWGRNMIYEDTPGLLEWLMDRQAACGVHPRTGSGADPEMLRAKYAVVKNLLDLGEPGISHEVKQRMQTFIAEGPLFMRGQYEVAMDGE